MPEIQSRPLPPDIEYFLDGAVEYCELDAASSLILRAYGDRARMIAIHDNPAHARVSQWIGPTKHTASIARDLAEYAWQIADEHFSIEERGCFCAMGLTHMQHQCGALAEHMASWAIGDCVEGGYAKAHRRLPPSRKYQLMPSPRNARRLRAPGWIRRYVRHNDSARKSRTDAERLIARTAGIPRHLVRCDREKTGAIWEEAYDRQRDAERAATARVEAQLGAGFDEVDWRTAPREGPHTPRFSAAARRKARKLRKVAKRSLQVAQQVLGDEHARALVHGASVFLEGLEVDFEIRRRLHLGSAQGHGALDVCLLSKESGKLADLCLYFEKTPPLDQAVAMKLHIDSGLERELISTANIVQATPAGEAHPIIIEKRKERMEERENARVEDLAEMILRRGVLLVDHEARRERDHAYWQEMEPTWVEATRVFVLGRWARAELTA